MCILFFSVSRTTPVKAETPPSPSSAAKAEKLPGKTFTFVLSYTPDIFKLENNKAEFKERNAPFAKEPPEFKGHTIYRADLTAPACTTIHLAWDLTSGTLLLDRNHNDDLTDDPADIYKDHKAVRPGAEIVRVSPDIPFDYSSCSLRANLKLTVPTHKVPLNGEYHARASVRSGWSGEIDLYGTKWWIALAEDLDGLINQDDLMILKPGNPSDENPISADNQDKIQIARTMVFGGHVYDKFLQPGSQKNVIKLILTEKKSLPMGMVKIAGKNIHRLILKLENPDRDYNALYYKTVALFNSPVSGSIFSVPAETYETEVELCSGSGPIFFSNEKSVIVHKNALTIANLGGPLNPTVTVERGETILQFGYELMGIGGESYHLRDKNTPASQRLSPPVITIYKGDKKIAVADREHG